MTADRSVLIPSQAYDMGTLRDEEECPRNLLCWPNLAAFHLPDLAQRTDHNWFGPRSGKTR